MKKMESFKINYNNKNYNGLITNKIGKFLFYKSIKNYRPSFILDKVKPTRKIQ